MTDKSKKVGPQGTQVFDLSDVESLLANELKKQGAEGKGPPALVGVTKPFSGERYVLTRDRYQVGRTDSSDIRLDEPSVSSTHAKLVRFNQNWRVVNLLSSNGTFVNGDKVTEKDLVPGDRVRFGGVEFIFVLTDKESIQEDLSEGLGLGAKIILLGGITVALLGLAAFFLL